MKQEFLETCKSHRKVSRRQNSLDSVKMMLNPHSLIPYWQSRFRFFLENLTKKLVNFSIIVSFPVIFLILERFGLTPSKETLTF